MEKNEYTVTKVAGRSIGGVRNPGLGGSVFLTETQAEHLVRVGQIEPVGAPVATAVPAADPADEVETPVDEVETPADESEDAPSEDETKPRSRRRRKSDGGD